MFLNGEMLKLLRCLVHLGQFQRVAFAAAEGDCACAVAERLTRKGWPLAANPWRALRKCIVGIGRSEFKKTRRRGVAPEAVWATELMRLQCMGRDRGEQTGPPEKSPEPTQLGRD